MFDIDLESEDVSDAEVRKPCDCQEGDSVSYTLTVFVFHATP